MEEKSLNTLNQGTYTLKHYGFTVYEKLTCLFKPVKVANICKNISWRHDIQHNDIQYHNTQHNDTQHNDIQYHNTQHNDTQHNDTQHNDTQHNGT
jgi:hypothetical protein